MLTKNTLAAITATTIVTLSGAAQAEMVTFDLEWSGASYGNSATATGTLVLDISESFMTSGGYINLGSPASFQSFALTIENASSGNGSFSIANSDFSDVFLNTGAGLDFSMNLVGQATFYDFNFFSQSGGVGPTGWGPNIFGTDNGFVELLELTSMTVQVVPLPPAAFAGLGLLGVLGIKRRYRS